MKNENLRLSIYILFTLALSFTVLFGCGVIATTTKQNR